MISKKENPSLQGAAAAHVLQEMESGPSAPKRQCTTMRTGHYWVSTAGKQNKLAFVCNRRYGI